MLTRRKKTKKISKEGKKSCTFVKNVIVGTQQVKNNMEKKELEVIICIGVPASGKSTWVKEFIAKNPSYVKVSRDDFRYMLKNTGWCEPKIEKMITDLHNNTVLTALSNKLNVVIDNTNVKVKTINEIVELVREVANVSYRVFDVPLKTLYERDAARERSVGKDVIDRMYNDYQILKDSFDFQPVKKVKKKKVIVPNYKSGLTDAVIFDMDGTLAIMSDKREAYDWDKVDMDDLNEVVAEQVRFHKSLGRKIIIMSGRDIVSKERTVEWLKFYNVEYDMILMRPFNNYEKDKIVKRRLYEEFIEGRYNVIAWYDDRLQVIELIYDLGIFCFNVNQGLKPF